MLWWCWHISVLLLQWALEREYALLDTVATIGALAYIDSVAVHELNLGVIRRPSEKMHAQPICMSPTFNLWKASYIQHTGQEHPCYAYC